MLQSSPVLAFSALADPTRQRIVELLAAREMAAGDIASRFEVSPPAISQHLKVLREARLVRVRVDAQRRIYRLDSASLGEAEAWLRRIRHFWRERLDELARQLDDAGNGKTRDKSVLKRGRTS